MEVIRREWDGTTDANSELDPSHRNLEYVLTGRPLKLIDQTSFRYYET